MPRDERWSYRIRRWYRIRYVIARRPLLIGPFGPQYMCSKASSLGMPFDAQKTPEHLTNGTAGRCCLVVLGPRLYGPVSALDMRGQRTHRKMSCAVLTHAVVQAVDTNPGAPFGFVQSWPSRRTILAVYDRRSVVRKELEWTPGIQNGKEAILPGFPWTGMLE